MATRSASGRVGAKTACWSWSRIPAPAFPTRRLTKIFKRFYSSRPEHGFRQQFRPRPGHLQADRRGAWRRDLGREHPPDRGRRDFGTAGRALRRGPADLTRWTGVPKLILHATAVCRQGRGLPDPRSVGQRQIGALALQLMARWAPASSPMTGVIVPSDGRGSADTRPRQIRGLIEARGLGLLRAEAAAASSLAWSSIWTQSETERLPHFDEIHAAGAGCALASQFRDRPFSCILMQYCVRAGQADGAWKMDCGPDRSTQRVVLVTGPSGAGPLDCDQRAGGSGLRGDRQHPAEPDSRAFSKARPLPRARSRWARRAQPRLHARRIAGSDAALGRRPELAADLLYLDWQPGHARAALFRDPTPASARPGRARPREGIAREIALLEDVRTQGRHPDRHVRPHARTTCAPRCRAGSPGRNRAGHGAVACIPFPTSAACRKGSTWSSTAGSCTIRTGSRACVTLTGLDPAVTDYIAEDPRTRPSVGRSTVLGLLRFQLPAASTRARRISRIGFGCTGGQHRSVAVPKTWPHALRGGLAGVN